MVLVIKTKSLSDFPGICENIYIKHIRRPWRSKNANQMLEKDVFSSNRIVFKWVFSLMETQCTALSISSLSNSSISYTSLIEKQSQMEACVQVQYNYFCSKTLMLFCEKI